MERNKVREQDPRLRARNFDEVSLGFDEDSAIKEAMRCLNCKKPLCKALCPVGVNIPEFINEVKKCDFEAAARVLKETNSLPAVCGRVCPQERQCESGCICGKSDKLGGAVAIGALERFVADWALAHQKDIVKPVSNGKRVAVIGSGPAGLTCAGELARSGYEVTVYEAFHRAGGVLVYGIPEFRLPKSLVQAEIDNLVALGVKIVCNVIVGKTITVDELLDENEAVFIGTGAGLPMFMRIKGENLNGVYSANEYLTRINLMRAYEKDSATPVVVGKKVVVVGAGNVAMDSARTALRMGAEEVRIVYRRSRNEMPARLEEIHHAEEEGIIFELLTNPVEILGERSVTGIKCVRMRLTEADASGRAKPVEIEGSEFIVECDQVIMALGTSPNPLLKKSMPELEVTSKGTIVVCEDTMETNIPSVYAGGDAVTGAATVILAMGAGKRAAKAIMEKIG